MLQCLASPRSQPMVSNSTASAAVEARLASYGIERTWILSNPIYLR